MNDERREGHRPRRAVGEMSTLGANTRRLYGLHGLTATKAAYLIDISAQAMSELDKRSNPRKDTVLLIAAFFEIDYARLWDTPFEELLTSEIPDLDRFQKVEEKIRAGEPQDREMILAET